MNGVQRAFQDLDEDSIIDSESAKDNSDVYDSG